MSLTAHYGQAVRAALTACLLAALLCVGSAPPACAQAFGGQVAAASGKPHGQAQRTKSRTADKNKGPAPPTLRMQDDLPIEIGNDQLGEAPETTYVAVYDAAPNDDEKAPAARCAQLKRSDKNILICFYRDAVDAAATRVVEDPGSPKISLSLEPSRVPNWLVQLIASRFAIPNIGSLANNKKTVISLTGWIADLEDFLLEGNPQDRPFLQMTTRSPVAIDTDDKKKTFDALQKSFRPQVEAALAQRAAVLATLNMLIDDKGHADGIDLAVPALANLAKKSGDESPVSVGDRLNALSGRHRSEPPAYMRDPTVKSAVDGLFRSKYFADGVTADRVDQLNFLANSALPPPPSEFPWKWVAIAMAAALLFAILAFFVGPLPKWQERQAITRAGRNNGFLKVSGDINRFLQGIDRDRRDLAQETREHFIWLMTRGGYSTALQMLKTENDTLWNSKEPAPELVEYAAKNVRTLRDLRQSGAKELAEARTSLQDRLMQAEQQHAQLVGGAADNEKTIIEGAANLFGLNRAEVSVANLTAIERERLGRFETLVGHLIPGVEPQNIVRNTLAANWTALQPEFNRLDTARHDASVLSDVEHTLRDYTADRSLGSERALDLASSASRTAATLRDIAARHTLSVSQDPEVLAKSVDTALNDAREGRELKAANHEAKALILSDPDVGATHDMPLGEAVKKLLQRLGFWRADSAAKQTDLRAAEDKTAALKEALANESLERSKAESAKQATESFLGDILSKIADIDPALARKLGMLGADGYDSAVALDVVSRLDRKLLVLDSITKGLRAAGRTLASGGRPDVVGALSVDRICDGLEQLHADSMLLLGPEGRTLDDETKYRRIYLPRMGKADLHLLFRADAVLSTYFHGDNDLYYLKTFISLAAILVELQMREIGVRVVRPDLLVRPPPDAVVRFGVEPEFRALKEVRVALAPHISQSDGVVVDLYEIGIEAPNRSYAPRIYVLNPAEWS